MSLRDTMNSNPAAVTGGAVVLLLLCLFLVYCQFGGGGGGSYSAIYYDVSNQQIQIVKAKIGNPPSSPLDDGSEVYQAHVFSCGECGEITEGMSVEDLEAGGMFIGYLAKWDADTADEFGDQYLLRTMKSEKWVSANSNVGINITDPSPRCGPGKYATECSIARD